MNVRLLIDSIVRQTTVLIAQLATSGGVRAPLAHIANQVFLELARELDAQGVRRKVSADMFGMAIRAYHRKLQRLAESYTDRGRSLWEAMVEFIESREMVTREEVFRRFKRDDETVVRSVLPDSLRCAEGQPARQCDLGCDSDDQCSSLSARMQCNQEFCRDLAFPPSDTGADAAADVDGQSPDAGSATDARAEDIFKGREAGVLDTGADSATDGGTVGARQGDPCSVLVPCEPPLVCGVSDTCEVHTVVTHGDGRLGTMVVRGAYIYWTDWGKEDDLRNYVQEGKIARASISGGPQEVIVDEVYKAYRGFLLVDDSHVYYMADLNDDWNLTLWRAPAGGSGVPEQLGASIRVSDCVTQDATHLYLIDDQLALYAFDKSGGTMAQVAQVSDAQTDAYCGAIGVDDETVYVAVNGLNLNIWIEIVSFDKQTWTQSVLTDWGQSYDEVQLLEVVGDDLIVAAEGFGEDTVMRIARQGLETTNRALYLNGDSFVVYDGYVYWLDWGSDQDSVFRVPLKSGQNQELLRFPDTMDRTEIAVSDAGLFWNDSDNDNAIMRLDLPGTR